MRIFMRKIETKTIPAWDPEDSKTWYVSISQVAAEFDMARDTVTRRIDQYRVKAGGKRNGYLVYPLGAVLHALFPENYRAPCPHCKRAGRI